MAWKKLNGLMGGQMPPVPTTITPPAAPKAFPNLPTPQPIKVQPVQLPRAEYSAQQHQVNRDAFGKIKELFAMRKRDKGLPRV